MCIPLVGRSSSVNIIGLQAYYPTPQGSPLYGSYFFYLILNEKEVLTLKVSTCGDPGGDGLQTSRGYGLQTFLDDPEASIYLKKSNGSLPMGLLWG